jgi:uncharacterized protein
LTPDICYYFFMKTGDVFEKIRLICSNYPSVQQAWIFGSQARGDANERSDIDVAISGIPFRDPQWSELLEELDKIPTLRTIDCHNLEIAPQNLKKRIFQEGYILYGQH